jgi:hypothetical protein
MNAHSFCLPSCNLQVSEVQAVVPASINNGSDQAKSMHILAFIGKLLHQLIAVQGWLLSWLTRS